MTTKPLHASRLFLLCLAILTTPAQAIILDFTQTGTAPFGSGSISNTILGQEGGVGYIIGGYKVDPVTGAAYLLPETDNAGNPLGVYTGTTGLGVASYATDNYDLDGSSVIEMLLFTFATRVTLNRIRFSRFNSSGPCTSGCDDFNLSIDGSNVLIDEQPPGTGTFWYTVPGANSGILFAITADGANDDFRIAALDITVVPLPAAAWLFISGLIGIGLIRKLPTPRPEGRGISRTPKNLRKIRSS